jgi:hypothetical protein
MINYYVLTIYYCRYPELLSHALLNTRFEQLKSTLSSSTQTSRQYAFEILSLYDQLGLIVTESGQRSETCQLLHECALVEQVPNTVRDYRGKFIYLRKWASLAEIGRLPAMYEEALIRLCIGK